jgi:hypothetical protein
MKSFMVYVDQKEGSTSSPKPRVSEISLNQRNSPFSPPTFTSRFCVLDHEHVVDVSENATARALSVSAPETDPTYSPQNCTVLYKSTQANSHKRQQCKHASGVILHKPLSVKNQRSY